MAAEPVEHHDFQVTVWVSWEIETRNQELENASSFDKLWIVKQLGVNQFSFGNNTVNFLPLKLVTSSKTISGTN